MEKQMINLEYPLATKSPSIVWGLISNAAGLQKWLADYVEEEGDKMVFSWGKEWTEQDKKSATVVSRERNKAIRLRWTSYQPHEYWEMRIEQSELTGLLCLKVTDFAEADDVDDICDLWDDNMKRLHRISGV